MNGNEPAYPTANNRNQGLSKRELLAAMAMQGLSYHEGYDFRDIAKESVIMADMLLVELAK